MAKKPESALELPTHHGSIRDVTAHGIRTRVLEAGSPEAPPLLLIHGMHQSHRSFEDVIDELAQRFHVIAPDLPGFGESEKPNPADYSYGIETHAESIADLIAAFDLGRAAVLGHGMGGSVALMLASQHPELVQRLIVVDPLCYPAPRSFRSRLFLFPVVGAIAFKQLFGRSHFRAFFREEVYGASVPLPLDRVDWHYDAFNSPAARESAHAVLRATLDTRAVVARLSRIVAPTLVFWGRRDRLYPVAAAHRLARQIQGARLEIMDTGHALHEENPREFIARLREFLEGRR